MISIHTQYIVNYERRTWAKNNRQTKMTTTTHKKSTRCLTWNFFCKLNWFVVCGLDNTSNLFSDSCNQSDVDSRTSNLLCKWSRGEMWVCVILILILIYEPAHFKVITTDRPSMFRILTQIDAYVMHSSTISFHTRAHILIFSWKYFFRFVTFFRIIHNK